MSIYLHHLNYYKYAYRRNPTLDLMPVCSSLDNFFVPLFAGITGTIHEYKGRKILVYNLKEGSIRMSLPRTITRFIFSFHDNGSHVYTDGDIEYHTMKHFIYMRTSDNDILPLYCLCTTRDHIFKVDPTDDLDYPNFYLLINNDLLSNPIYAGMATKVKPLIKYFKDKGVSLVYTDDIKRLCFNPPSEQRSFNTFREREEFINNIKKQLGLHDPTKEKIVEDAESLISDFATIASTDTQDLF